jgi:tRNA nucleotidyltransferase (CCA-adding enzyme)
MVGKGTMPSSEKPIEDLPAALRDAHPELEAVREAASDPVYLVGGAVRDLLLGQPRADVDLVVEGDAAALAARLGADAVEHERFGTVKVELDGHEVDIAAARTETYDRPGALPAVEPADTVEADLARRDFTINAMAIPLASEAGLIDPHGGREDLDRGLIRVLHPGSFVDDPTRAIRAARYAARFGFSLEPETERLLREANLGAVSVDRQRAELERLAREAAGPLGLAFLSEWGLIEPRDGGIELATRVAKLLSSPPWREVADRADAVLAAALGPVGREAELAVAQPDMPSRAVELAGAHGAIELVLARALGAEWLDRYLEEWQGVRLAIDGDDLIAAGVPQGPAVGRGLAAALRAKLDGETRNRDEELARALAAARET